jgi:hypothetical protein
MSTQAPTPEFALAYRDTMLDGFANEVETTKKVVSCIPDNNRDYRPDPNARTAWEPAWHLGRVAHVSGCPTFRFLKRGC